jgi:hypothetical protein
MFSNYINNCSILFSVTSRSALGPTLPTVPWVPGDLPKGVKRQGREALHLPPSSAKVKSDEAVPPLPDTSSWRGA